MGKIKNFFRVLESYLFGVKLKTIESPLNGTLELWLINNKKELNTKNANQSFGSMQEIFRKVFETIKLKEKKTDKILLLGLGCGTIPEIIFEELKLNCSMTAVEYDPIMIGIAKDHFDILRFKDLVIETGDAKKYVNECPDKFDLIVVDLFNDDVVPEDFLQLDFLKRVCECLNDEGMLVFNMVTRTKLQQSKFVELKKYFAHSEVIKIFSNSVLVHKKSM
ncbi:MAG: spermidine synthase [Bacteroidia bacterium]